ncbi:M20 family metallopeptidase [Roseomonas sp. NAR14]|uniref:M20 family metallopeptidase n=2 Tax=Roseomonas acroporae TaxID=2937791 RepID=A0A9X1YB26_9PROT|nr:M20 aminoacylase family protein [Roseomonas acroporae]MCK8787459.1 M20 family metallopeptidase [Roseomonas acroporae]
MTGWRRDLHAHPELGFEEHRTAAFVADRLREAGVDEVVTGLAGTGVVGVIHGRRRRAAKGEGTGDAAAVGLRADMDALPIEEATGLPWASRTPGRMHACGHDGHTAMLLGAARHLAATRDFAGTVYAIFQPAEEGVGGGRAMVEAGLFRRFPMRQVFGLHNWPALPEGEFAWREGPIMAAVATLEATVTGTGAHGAMPHMGNDPVVIAAQIVTALQSVVSRSVDPAEAGVLTIGRISGGDTWNVIPESVSLLGTARWFRPEVGALIGRKFTAITEGVAAAFGARAEARMTVICPATVNAPGPTALAREAAESVAGAARVRALPLPTVVGEDFSYMLEALPGSYILLGAGRGPDDPQVHHPRYDFNDAILPLGAAWWAALAERALAPAADGAVA